MRSRRLSRKHAGLSRAEVVAISLMGLLLLALAIPWLNKSREGARRNTCEYRLTDLGMTMLFVADIHPKKQFPGYVNEQAVDAQGKRQPIGWAFELLPYLARPEALALENVAQGVNPKLFRRMPGPDVFGPRNQVHEQFGPHGSAEMRGKPPTAYLPEFLCPEDPRSGASARGATLSFVANCGLPDAPASGKFPADWPANAVFLERFANRDPQLVTSPQFVEGHDGASFTFLLSENIDAGLWTAASESAVGFLWAPGLPDGTHTQDCPVLFINEKRGRGDGSFRFARPSSQHAHGVNVIYCDGRTKFLDERIDFRVYVAQMTSDGANAKEPGSDKPLDPPYREVRDVPTKTP